MANDGPVREEIKTLGDYSCRHKIGKVLQVTEEPELLKITPEGL